MNFDENKQNMKSTGLRLLKKGKRGLFRVIFSRTGFVVLLLLLNILLIYALHLSFRESLPNINFVMGIFNMVMVIYLLNCNMDPTAKITWLVLMMLFHGVAAPLLFYIKSDFGHRQLKKRIEILNLKTKNMLSQRKSSRSVLLEKSKNEASMLNYLQNAGGFPAYDQCDVTYFPSGEKKFQELKNQLKQAKRFIFMEYFIIDEGKMWGEILEILAEKAKKGVDVRVIYDGSCEFTTLTRDYPAKLKTLGIKCQVFSPATPFVSTHYNYRDHRKIVVIDGHTAFTGGVNLADEYINEFPKYGHWKDAAIMIKGEAVRTFTLLFLQMWGINDKRSEFTRYLMSYAPRNQLAKGFVIPYGDCPLDKFRVGEMVYIDILNRATDYVHIMTPYLIIDGELLTALIYAAERGVKVSIIMPGIPDKKAPYAIAKTYYKPLMDAGVKIYEYSEGFVHSKVVVSDDCRAVVGTINLDYRSLYHHFECAAYLYECDCIKEIEKDFANTLQNCVPVNEEMLKNRSLFMKVQGWVLKAIAPLF